MSTIARPYAVHPHVHVHVLKVHVSADSLSSNNLVTAKDLSGELEFEEMVDGLLKCRGPVSKTDIIAIRLKSSLIVRMMNAVCEKLGIQDV